MKSQTHLKSTVKLSLVGLSIFLVLTLFFTFFINQPQVEANPSLSQPDQATIKILNASVEPLKVKSGDVMLVQAEVQENYGTNR